MCENAGGLSPPLCCVVSDDGTPPLYKVSEGSRRDCITKALLKLKNIHRKITMTFRRITRSVLLSVFFIFSISVLYSQQLAFPTAEGYGKYAKGGRGGTVYEVTNLNDSGEGSLRAAVDASGPRTVIFRVSGTIELESPLKIKNPYITIAGQTAPGDGICIRKNPISIDADHVIIRYLRVRLGDESGGDYDAVSSRYTKHIILDHISASWSVDECMSIYHCDSVTVQWSIISESMSKSNHVKGSHGFGGIWGSNYGTYHHNLLAHHTSRNPRMASGSGYTDYRNNVIYNWGYQSLYGGEKYQKGNDKFNFSNFNIVANYYKPGPATRPGEVMNRIANPSFRNSDDYGEWYIAENIVEGNEDVSSDNWNGGVQTKIPFKKIRLDTPWPAMPIKQQTALEAYHSVLDNAGAILPKRDAVDTRIIKETRGGFATYEGVSYEKEREVADPSKICGIIDTQKDVGGWPELKSEPAPTDTDRDGMPDSWESANGLNPGDPQDRNKVASDGYTMLEKYINGIK
jgi:pectate lyase